MSKRILLILSHSIEEYDQLRLLSGLGYEVFSLGGYIEPRHPHDPKRPALDLPGVPELKAVVDAQGQPDNIGYAASNIPPEFFEWLGDDGIIIAHHYLEDRIFPQWEQRLQPWIDRGGRVIRRTVGQSMEGNERRASLYVDRGLETVRYSPKEEAIPGYYGRDALIRFWKDPQEWSGWVGDRELAINITQHLMQRGEATHGDWWLKATNGLPALALGPGSEVIGGPGEISLAEMQGWLREARVYVYTGTQPASYTLGLIEAAMTGIPIVSIGPDQMWVPGMFEGHEIAMRWSNDPLEAAGFVRQLLVDYDLARAVAVRQRQKALELFHPAVIGRQWKEYLG